jgi:SAM-dependent methyltransferase
MNDFSRYDPDLLALIPPDAKTVLEIGCGAGRLCEMYRRINPRVHWIGTDFDQAACDRARAHCTEVFEFDFNVAKVIAEDNPADCVVLRDVLERLEDPWAKLKTLASITKPGGQVLASIPNVGHWTVIRDLLAGKWDYTDEGLLKRTHLRFFTRKSIMEMFAGAGLRVFEVRGRDMCNEGIHEFVAASGVKLTKEARAYQYIVRAVKPDVDRIQKIVEPLHIHAVLGEACCARPRILEPFRMLETIPGVATSTEPRPDGRIYAGSKHGNSVIIQQRARMIIPERQKFYLDHGNILIAEIDDLPEAIGVAPLALKAVHAIQTTTERMAETLREFNPNVYVFPNQIARIEPLPEKDDNPDPAIFYGAQNRESDWVPIMPAINRVIKDHPNIRFSVIHDRRFFDALETNRKSFEPFCEYDQYRKTLRACSIALVPLEPTRANEHKSDLKFLECAAEGMAVLASEFAADHFQREPHTNDGYYCWTHLDRFEWLLRRLITTPEARQEVTTKAYNYVRDYRLLSRHYRQLHQWYLSLLSAKPTLDRELRTRCPELWPESPQSVLQESCSGPP